MYALHTLGWNDFQQLCLTITREILGQSVQSFLDSRDGGRDGAFSGIWRTQGEESLAGAFVIQCKYTSRNGHNLSVSELSEEVEKARRLVIRGLCDTYVLMTNAGVSGTTEEKIREIFRSVGVAHFAIFGSTWICQQIRETKRLRMLVPRMYGLGDLSQILDERAYTQARVMLESMREDLAKVVITDAYRKSAEAISEHGFVLLIGEPAAGKTTIASLLGMAALDQWNASTLKIDEPRMMFDRWNPDESSQFFWIDDAFGVTQYEHLLVQRWNHILPQLKPMLRGGAKIVMTSRNYIYAAARTELKESAFPLLNESKVVIDVHDLTLREKRQMLYNHLKLGRQTRQFRSVAKPFLESIAADSLFVPETARRFSDPLYTKSLSMDSHSIGRFVRHRDQFQQEVIRSLDVHSRAALALVYMRSGQLESPIELQLSELKALERIGSDVGQSVRALEALKGALVLLVSTESAAFWQFKHPTVGDAYASVLAESSEHLGIFVEGTAIKQLLSKVTCGDVGIQNAVIVSRSLFPQMLRRLNEIRGDGAAGSPWHTTFNAREAMINFLTFRCSKEFLAYFLPHHPDILTRVAEPWLSLETAPEVHLATRLHQSGLLPESTRRKFVETVSNYAINGEDSEALSNSSIRSVFTPEESEALRASISDELLPRLSQVRREWESNASGDQAEADMQGFFNLLDALVEHFGEEEKVLHSINGERERAIDWVHEQADHKIKPARAHRELMAIAPQADSIIERSIFDDIDADE
jgi:hypothetical protein